MLRLLSIIPKIIIKIRTIVVLLLLGLLGSLFMCGASAQGVPTSGVWEYRKDTDEFTDEVRHFLFMAPEEISENTGLMAMAITCIGNITDFNIEAGNLLLAESIGGEYDREVDYRIDKLKAQKFRAYSSSTLFSPYEDGVDIPLIKSMFNHDKFLIRFPTHNGRETLTFKITGIETKIKPIREACNW